MQSGAWFAKKVLFEPHPFARAPPARLSPTRSLCDLIGWPSPTRSLEPHSFARAPLPIKGQDTNLTSIEGTTR